MINYFNILEIKEMKNKFLLGFVACALFASVFTGCSNSDDILNNEGNKENVDSKVAPLTITIGKSTKSSRVIIDDNNGKGGSSNDAVFAIDSLKWETSDYLWAYSPDYVDTENNIKGGYTRLKLNSVPGGQTAQFVADGESKYVSGKPLYIYYHGGNQESPNSLPVDMDATQGVGDGTIATLTRPYDNSDDTKSSAVFHLGKDSKKSVKEDPFFLRSAYIESVPNTGVIPNCTLQGRTSLLSLRIPWGHGLVGTLTDLLGLMQFDITIACKDDDGKWAFPKKVSLKHDSDGNLTETVDSYGDPLKFTIDEMGATNLKGHPLYLANGMVYVSIPAVNYKNLRVEVKMKNLTTSQGALSILLPNLDIANQVLTCPATDKVLNLNLNPNNIGKYPADYIYGLGNVLAVGSHDFSGLSMKNPYYWLLQGLGQVVGVYSIPGKNWVTNDGSLIEINK